MGGFRPEHLKGLLGGGGGGGGRGVKSNSKSILMRYKNGVLCIGSVSTLSQI